MTETVGLATALVVSNSARGVPSPLAMCYGVSQPAGARCCWMRRWRPWTTAFFNANLSLFHRDHVCTTHRLLHLQRLWGWHRVHRTIAGTAGHRKGRLASVLDGFNAIFSLQQKQRMWDHQREHLQVYSLSEQLLSTPVYPNGQ